MIQQIAVGPVDLDSVKTGLTRHFGRVDIIGDDAWHLVEFQRTGFGCGGHPVLGKGFNIRRDGRRGDGFLTIRLDINMADPAHMPQLDHDLAAFGVHRIGYLFPCGNLPFGVDARRFDVPFAFGADLGRFGDDDPGPGALCVVFDVHIADFAGVVIGAAAGQRGHNNAVRGLDCAGFQRGE